MSELEFYICHAGQHINQYQSESDSKGVGELGVVGCLYVFRGVYVRSPNECVDSDKMEVMELQSMANGNTCWGSLDSFSRVPHAPWLVEWASSNV